MSTEQLLTEIRDALVELVALQRGKKPVVWPPVDRTLAPDRDLEGPYGDPLVKTAPRDWNGPFTSGQHMSECDPVLLDLIADRYEYFAQKNDREHNMTDKGYPKSKFDRAAAAKARAWAARLRKGHKKPAAPPMDETPDWGDGNAAF